MQGLLARKSEKRARVTTIHARSPAVAIVRYSGDQRITMHPPSQWKWGVNDSAMEVGPTARRQLDRTAAEKTTVGWGAESIYCTIPHAEVLPEKVSPLPDGTLKFPAFSLRPPSFCFSHLEPLLFANVYVPGTASDTRLYAVVCISGIRCVFLNRPWSTVRSGSV